MILLLRKVKHLIDKEKPSGVFAGIGMCVEEEKELVRELVELCLWSFPGFISCCGCESTPHKKRAANFAARLIVCLFFHCVKKCLNVFPLGMGWNITAGRCDKVLEFTAFCHQFTGG